MPLPKCNEGWARVGPAKANKIASANKQLSPSVCQPRGMNEKNPKRKPYKRSSPPTMIKNLRRCRKNVLRMYAAGPGKQANCRSVARASNPAFNAATTSCTCVPEPRQRPKKGKTSPFTHRFAQLRTYTHRSRTTYGKASRGPEVRQLAFYAGIDAWPR